MQKTTFYICTSNLTPKPMGAKRKFSIPNNFVIVFWIIAICALLTWFLPGGQYVKSDSGTVVFQHVDSVPQTYQLFTSFFKGFEKGAGIIIFILVVGGAFWVVNSNGAIDVGIYSFLHKSKGWERYWLVRKLGVNNVIMVSIMLIFSLFGAVFGMSEETIAFAVVIIPLAISMGYDSLVGLGLVYVAAHTGFAGAMLNPFTVGIAQQLSGIPLFSGLEYRFVCWIILNVALMIFVLRYASKVKRNPQKSIVYHEDKFWRDRFAEEKSHVKYETPQAAWWAFALCLAVLVAFAVAFPTTTLEIGKSQLPAIPIIPISAALFAWLCWKSLKKSVHFFILQLLGFTILFLIVGVMGYGWGIDKIAGLFFALGLVSGYAIGYTANDIVKHFMDGAKDFMSAAIIVGFAGGIIVILQDGKVVDTILYGLSSTLGAYGKIAATETIYGIITLINMIIPSGSAKAALTIPIFAPFSDIIGISRQATVMAFQLGGGFTEMITPISGVLIGVLGVAKVPYAKWIRWVLPYILVLILIGALLLIPTVTMNLNGFEVVSTVK